MVCILRTKFVAGKPGVRNLEKQIAQVDAEIDQRVYELYRLTDEEIKIVERS